MVIDEKLLDEVSEQAKTSPRLCMNYNFHQGLDKEQRGRVFHRKPKSLIINS